MRTFALIFLCLGSALALDWTNFYVKWNTILLDPFRWNSYFAIPRTSADAISEGWTLTADVNSHEVTAYCYPNDPTICLLFDNNGYIAGFQAGINADDVAEYQSVYNMSLQNLYTRKTIGTTDLWTTTVYTVDPDTIDAGGRSSMDGLTGTEGLWMDSSDGLIYIPRDVADLDSIWTKENCISGMGTHYYYAMLPTMECKDFHPWFLLYLDGELSGLGLQAFGSCSIVKRSWCEWVPALAIKPTIPNAPDCLVDWAGNYGVISIHFYFTEKPWNISC